MTVVAFPSRQPDVLVWRCECGCLTQYVRSDGSLECPGCKGIAVGAGGEWRSHLPEVPAAPVETDPGDVVVTDIGDASIAIKRTLKKADPDKMVALVVVHDDGRLSVWGQDFDTSEQKAWLERKFAEAVSLLSKA